MTQKFNSSIISMIYLWRLCFGNRLIIDFISRYIINAVNINILGSETQDTSSEESSVSSDDNSALDCQHVWSSKNNKIYKNSGFQNLGEAQARKFKLMSSLVKILKLIDNGKIWIISSFVLIDKLSMIGDVIPSEDLHW